MPAAAGRSADTEQQGRDAPAGQERQSEASHNAKEHQLSGFAHDQAEHVEPAGAECDPDSDFRASLRHDVGQHAVEANNGQRDREHAEESRQHRQQPFADESIANARLEDREFDNRGRITLPETLPDPGDGYIRRHVRVNHDVAPALATDAANRDRTPSAGARLACRCTGFGYDADDLVHRRGITRFLSRAQRLADRIGSARELFDECLVDDRHARGRSRIAQVKSRPRCTGMPIVLK